MMIRRAGETESGLGSRPGSREGDSELARLVFGGAKRRGVVARHPLEQALIGTRQPNGVGVEVHQPLQMDFLDPDVGREPDEGGKLRDRFLEAGQPKGDARRRRSGAFLVGAEAADVAQDAVEEIDAPHGEKALSRGRVERDAKLVEPGLDERPPVAPCRWC
jgi:hypothetical protein